MSYGEATQDVLSKMVGVYVAVQKSKLLENRFSCSGIEVMRWTKKNQQAGTACMEPMCLPASNDLEAQELSLIGLLSPVEYISISLYIIVIIYCLH